MGPVHETDETNVRLSETHALDLRLELNCALSKPFVEQLLVHVVHD
jgi:hypothetical protein